MQKYHSAKSDLKREMICKTSLAPSTSTNAYSIRMGVFKSATHAHIEAIGSSRAKPLARQTSLGAWLCVESENAGTRRRAVRKHIKNFFSSLNTLSIIYVVQSGRRERERERERERRRERGALLLFLPLPFCGRRYVFQL
jgi:hypothetical protein